MRRWWMLSMLQATFLSLLLFSWCSTMLLLHTWSGANTSFVLDGFISSPQKNCGRIFYNFSLLGRIVFARNKVTSSKRRKNFAHLWWLYLSQAMACFGYIPQEWRCSLGITCAHVACSTAIGFLRLFKLQAPSLVVNLAFWHAWWRWRIVFTFLMSYTLRIAWPSMRIKFSQFFVRLVFGILSWVVQVSKYWRTCHSTTLATSVFFLSNKLHNCTMASIDLYWWKNGRHRKGTVAFDKEAGVQLRAAVVEEALSR